MIAADVATWHPFALHKAHDRPAVFNSNPAPYSALVATKLDMCRPFRLMAHSLGDARCGSRELAGSRTHYFAHELVFLPIDFLEEFLGVRIRAHRSGHTG